MPFVVLLRHFSALFDLCLIVFEAVSEGFCSLEGPLAGERVLGGMHLRSLVLLAWQGLLAVRAFLGPNANIS